MISVKKAYTYPTYDITHKKNCNPKLSNFLKIPTRRLTTSFEGQKECIKGLIFFHLS